MLPRDAGRSRDTLLLTIWLALFVCCFWLVEEFAGEWQLFGPNPSSRKIHAFVGLSLILALPYGLLLQRKRLSVNIAYAACLVFLAASLSPTALQTDQVRYVWDGILTIRGENPYTFAPADHPFFSRYPGNQYLNHPQLPTIYPPLAQWVFGTSTVLNPMLWNEVLGWEWAPVQNVSPGFKLEIGWKIMTGLIAALSLIMLRSRRWDLFFLHPLILVTWLGNAHVDVLMCASLIFLFERGRRFLRPCSTHPLHVRTQVKPAVAALRESVALSAGILTKGTPVLFVPFFVFRWFRQFHRPRLAWANIALCVILVTVPVMFYQITSNGNFFHSPKVFARNWTFFGYLNGFCSDFAQLIGLSDPFQWARVTSLIMWIPLYLLLVGLAYRAKISTRMLCFLANSSLLWFSPTIHPWYLISMLYLGMPYLQLLPVIWVWPVLALTSQIYYLDRVDPILLRYGVYATVTIGNVMLLKALWKHREQLRPRNP